MTYNKFAGPELRAALRRFVFGGFPARRETRESPVETRHHHHHHHFPQWKPGITARTLSWRTMKLSRKCMKHSMHMKSRVKNVSNDWAELSSSQYCNILQYLFFTCEKKSADGLSCRGSDNTRFPSRFNCHLLRGLFKQYQELVERG